MDKPLFLDDDLLLELFPERSVWETVYFYFRQAFQASSLYSNHPPGAEKVFNLAFAALRQEIAEKGISVPLSLPLYSHLLLLADLHEGKRLQNARERNTIEEKSSKHQGIYLGGEVLLQLLYKDHEQATKLVFERYRNSALRIITQKMRRDSEQLLEAYGEAMGEFIFNIKKGKVVPPLRAQLFTYFFRIFRNRSVNYLRAVDANPTNPLPENLEDLEQYLKGEESSQQYYFLYIQERLAPSNPNPTPDEYGIVEQLINLLDNLCQEIVSLRFFKEKNRLLSHREIAAYLDIEEGAARKRFFECMKKLRHELNIKPR